MICDLSMLVSAVVHHCPCCVPACCRALDGGKTGCLPSLPRQERQRFAQDPEWLKKDFDWKAEVPPIKAGERRRVSIIYEVSNSRGSTACAPGLSMCTMASFPGVLH